MGWTDHQVPPGSLGPTSRTHPEEAYRCIGHDVKKKKKKKKKKKLSNIKYGITIWGTTNSTLINKVQKLQNFAIKVADGKARKYDYVTPLFKDLQWIKIKDLITFNLITKVFKQKIKDYPDHILSLPIVNYMTDSTTRQ